MKRNESKELLIEVWCSPLNENEEESNKVSDKAVFVGMCLFSINDLISTTPSQTRIVHLQKRPFEEESESTRQTMMAILVRLIIYLSMDQCRLSYNLHIKLVMGPGQKNYPHRARSIF